MKKRLLIKVETTFPNPKKVLGASEATDNGSFFLGGGGRNKLGTGKNLTDIRVDKEADRSRLFSKY